MLTEVEIEAPVKYFVTCFLGSLFIRSFSAFHKAFAMEREDSPDFYAYLGTVSKIRERAQAKSAEIRKCPVLWSLCRIVVRTPLSAFVFFRRFWLAFRGFGAGPKIDDYWLPYLIGVSELIAFPLLLRSKDGVIVIGAWIGIKTAGQWQGWAASRVAFNRFLFATIMLLGLSYFMASEWVRSQWGLPL